MIWWWSKTETTGGGGGGGGGGTLQKRAEVNTSTVTITLTHRCYTQMQEYLAAYLVWIAVVKR